MIEKKQKIHAREINTIVYEGVNGQLVAEGRLKDSRLMPYYQLTGEQHPPGTIHHMIIRLALALPGLTIKEIEVDMPTVPSELCRETRGFLESIKGLSIVPGFTAKINKLFGGPKGCCHLLELLTAMAPAVFQGAVSEGVRYPFDNMDPGPFINTCWLWREEGHWLQEIRAVQNTDGIRGPIVPIRRSTFD
jgi:hypothetical protein